MNSPAPIPVGRIGKWSDRRLALGLVLFLCALYLPFAGNYGLWDPWETHYSEVARQMLMRHDYVSLWWPGSPQDRNEFWSKPVLTFWLMAMGMRAAGLEQYSGPSRPPDFIGAAHDSEMAVGWAAEWAVRMPFILCAIVCVWAVWELTRRLAGRRAALWASLVLATSTQFFFIARQAMTDMAFVAPMTVALAMAGLALLLPKEEAEAELPRRSLGDGRLRFSWPHVPAFYGLAALAFFTVVPQLAVISAQINLSFTLGRHAFRIHGVVPMLPYIAGFLLFAWLAARATCRRQLYLYVAFLMCGLSTLAKGPAGIGLPVICVLVYLAAAGDWKRFLPPPPDPTATRWVDRRSGPLGFLARLFARHPLEIGLGALAFIVVAFPWYHAMLIRHGSGFWNEFIGDNYVHRAEGRHGDRGTFEYYLEQIGLGMFPWAGIVPAALLSALAGLRKRFDEANGRERLTVFALVWFLVMWAVVTLVNTKFHHYILPALPALAILAGLLLDDLLSRPKVGDALAVLLVGVPCVVLAGRDLAVFPARLSWLFDYDYVNAPNGGRAWPTDPAYDYTLRIAVFVACAALATLVVGAIALARARRKAHTDALSDAAPPSRGLLLVLAALPVLSVAAAELWQPPFGNGQPHPLANGWVLVAATTSLFLVLLLGRGLRDGETRAGTLGLVAVGVLACAWTGWALDRHLTDLSPHWSQKHVIAAYYEQRKGPEEPLIAWQMYWRGENFYTQNAIYDNRIPQEDKTVFLGTRNAEKMQEYFRTHGGRRVFFIVERSRFESLRALLPASARASLKPVDESNNKVYLAVAELPATPTPQSKPEPAK